MDQQWQNFWIRDWQIGDRHPAAAVVEQVLREYDLPWDLDGVDRELFEIEKCYWQRGGEFWVVESAGKIVGTAAYCPHRGEGAVEIRKMYLLPEVRGQGLGKYLLRELEGAIASRGFQQIWIETVSVLKEAVQLYENYGYKPSTGIETWRCDRIYVKDLD